MSNPQIQVAMQIILHAGDAKTLVMKCLDNIEHLDFQANVALLKEAESLITIAHQFQTDVVQAEAREEDIEFSLLFAHAQDTLMVIKSQLEVTKKLTSIIKMIDERLERLEQAK